MLKSVGFFMFKGNRKVIFAPIPTRVGGEERSTSKPAGAPTLAPSAEPAVGTSVEPTAQPSNEPNLVQTQKQSEAPTFTLVPSANPTTQPSNKPTLELVAPTLSPTLRQSEKLTMVPTIKNNLRSVKETVVLNENSTSLEPFKSYIISPASISNNITTAFIVANLGTSVEFVLGDYAGIQLVFRNITYSNNNYLIQIPLYKKELSITDWGWHDGDQENALHLSDISLLENAVNYEPINLLLSKEDSPACIVKAERIPEIILAQTPCKNLDKILKTIPSDIKEDSTTSWYSYGVPILVIGVVGAYYFAAYKCFKKGSHVVNPSSETQDDAHVAGAISTTASLSDIILCL